LKRRKPVRSENQSTEYFKGNGGARDSVSNVSRENGVKFRS